MDSNKVVWGEGMFLSPQHFQQQERYMENFTRDFIHCLYPSVYGLTTMTIDATKLDIGKISVEQAKGIFPDGTPFELTDALVLDIPKNIANKRVYLALPIMHWGAVEVGQDKQFRSDIREVTVSDSNQNSSDPIQMELAALNIQLKLEGQQDINDDSLICIAEVLEHKVEGRVVLNQAFIPQCLNAKVSRYLTHCITDLFTKTQYRARTISTRINAESERKSPHSMVRDYLWLQVLGAWVSRFEQYHQDEMIATKALYLELVSMAAQMQGVEGMMPMSFPAWSYDNLYDIFSIVYSELQLLLQGAKFDSVNILQWDKRLFASRRLLRTMIKDRALYNNSRFILIVKSELDKAHIRQQFPKAAKLAGHTEIAQLVLNALPGIPLEHLSYTPSELQAHPDESLFELDTHSSLWNAIIKNEDAIALYIDNILEDIEVQFVVIK